MLFVLLISMFTLVLLGMDVVFVLYASATLVIGLTHFWSDVPIFFEVIAQYSYGGVDTFSFTAIPLFILAGEIMNRAGITDRLVQFASKMVGHIHGGIAQVGVALNMAMAGSSGSAVADCAATGSVLIPTMKKEGYSPEKSAAIIAAASTVGPVIPPSIPMIIIGGMAGISVGKLFIAGIIPGILMGLSMMVYLYFYAKRKKIKSYPKASFSERWDAIKKALLPIGMPVVILGTIITGVVSPTESAVIGVLYAIVTGVLVYKTINFKVLYEILRDSALSTGVIMLSTGAAVLFGWIATYLDIGDILSGIIFSVSDNPLVILLMINLVLLIMGMVMDAIPILLLMVPVVLPLTASIGIDPIHISIIMVINLMIGLITPPMGLHLFITSIIADVPISKVIRASVPFFLVLVAVLLAVTFIPQITMFLPDLLYD